MTDRKITREEWRNIVKNNATVQKIRAISEKYGYKVDYAYRRNYYGEPVIAIYEMDRNSYYPTVRFDTGKVCEHKEEDWRWEINASAYGSMTLSEYEVFVYQLTQAKRMVEELKDIDVKELPLQPNDEDFED